MPERVADRSSLAALLDDAAAALGDAGVPEPRREARGLWAAMAGGGLTPGDVWLARERAAAPDMERRFREAVERRASGIPFAYAVGRTAFRTLALALDGRALIPRPETEGLVDLALREVGKRNNGRGKGVAADIGTGCGCIALSLAVEGEGDFERVIAVERSPDAAALARDNVARVRPAVPVEVREGDLLAPLAGERCRLIVANPPYLTEAEYAELDPAVRLFEPRDALVSGADGLAATRALLGGARPLLERGGLLALEIDERRGDAVLALARRCGWRSATLHDDLFGRPRYLVARLEEDA